MAGALTEESNSPIGGLTLYGSSLSRPTAIYFPRADIKKNSVLNVIIWFHGYYVSSLKEIFHFYSGNEPDKNGDARLRQSVLNAKQDVVLVAPFLGYVPPGVSDEKKKAAVTQAEKDAIAKAEKAHAAGADRYATAEGELGRGSNGLKYLNEVLKAIAVYRDQSDSAAAPKLGNLYLACHSGGGEGMLDVVGSLGTYSANLKECWGFDCLYSSRYAGAARGSPKVRFYLYFGQGSTRERAYDIFAAKYGSIKGRVATDLGNAFVAPATTTKMPGVDDDSRAFRSVQEIKQASPMAASYESFRQDLDAQLGDKQKFTAFLRKNKLNLQGHYTVPATLMEPRIRQSLGQAASAP